jgi:Mn-dependent DtxR family transcriptional regulator
MKRQPDNAAIAREIIARLKVAPGSVTELADEMKTSPQVVKAAINRLLSAGAVAMFQGRSVEGGPFYCLPGYVELPSSVDLDDLYFGRDYARFYDNPLPDL